MSLSTGADTIDLENRRQMLETNLDKLRISLRHWQAWSAEYEGVKEEILALSTPSAKDLELICRTCSGSQLKKSELKDILGITSSNPRTAKQVVNVLDRRLEYVSQSTKTLEAQIDACEQQLNAVVVCKPPDVPYEETLPILDIIEELDDEDRVVQARVEIPGSSHGALEEILTQFCIEDGVLGDRTHQETVNDKTGLPTPTGDKEDMVLPVQPKARSVPIDIASPDVPYVGRSLGASEKLRSIMDRAKVLESPITTATVPDDESPEDSAMRKEMLKYGMSEVGAVVAELDLEESSDVSDFDDEGYDDEDEDVSSLDEEDQFGKSTRGAVNADIHERMEELERKLGFREMSNRESGEAAGLHGKSSGGREARAMKSAEECTDTGSEERITFERSPRNVRFADEINVSIINPSSVRTSKPGFTRTVAPPSKIDKQARPSSLQSKPLTALSSTVGSDSPRQSRPPHPLPAAAERHSWKFERTREVPSGPEGSVLAKVVQERDVSTSANEPDDLDSHLLYHEAATEYYRRRNLMVQKHGGFGGRNMDEEKTGIVEISEENGGPKKLSRFKAARLANT